MATTFNFEVQRRASKKGTFPIFIRITKDREHRRIKTSIELKRLSDWNPKAKDNKHIRPSEPHHEAWNDVLDKEINDAREVYREDKSASIASIQKAIQNKEVSESFLQYAKDKVEEDKSKEALGTYRQYASLINKLEAFMASERMDDISFNDVNLAFLNKFESYLGRSESQRYDGRKLHKNTIAGNLKRLRKIIRQALKEGLIPVQNNPFINFSIKEIRTKKDKLTEEEVDAIISLDLPEGSVMWHTRNAFLFSFYNAGMRAGDVLQLRWKNVEAGRLNYQMGKNHKVRDNQLVVGAVAILDYYNVEGVKESDFVFPFLDSQAEWARASYKGVETLDDELKKALFNHVASRNVILNRNLKKIAKLAGIEKEISFHTARHTFANMAMKEGLSASKIQGLLAHSSVKTTENYMGNFSSKETDDALAQVFKKDDQKSKEEAILEALRGLDKETLARVLEGLK